MNKKRVIFFGSGDFPRNTFEHLISSMKYLNNCPYEVVGLVTSHDKCEDNGKTLKEIASGSDIQIATVKNCDDEELYSWCKLLNPDIFVVISFKKIPKRLLELVDGNAFNVHASLLPLLTSTVMFSVESFSFINSLNNFDESIIRTFFILSILY